MREGLAGGTVVRLAAAGVIMAGSLWGSRPAAAGTTFSNPTPVTIPSPGQFGPPWKASSYPSTILVSGMTGTVSDVNVGLVDFDCYQSPPGEPAGGDGVYPDDMDVMLVGPTGADTMLVSDVGGDYNTGQTVQDLNLTLDDQASALVPVDSPSSPTPSPALTSGTFKPTDDDDDPDQLPVDTFFNQRPETPLDQRFTGPTPSGTPSLGRFNGTNPNGVWSLYVADDIAGFERCYLNGGWTLDITTTGPSVTVKPSVAASDVAVLEGDGGTTSAVFTVKRSGNTSASSSVTYATANGTATAGSDYAAIPATTLAFAAGETSKTVSVTVNGDAVREGNEDFKLNLSAPTNAVIGDTSATATLIDEEGPVFASISDVSVVEGNAGTTSATFDVTLSAPPAAGQAISVKYATANGTATSGSDYTAVPLTALTFGAGETSKPVTVSVTGDTASEANETFKLNLSAPAGGLVLADTSGTATIRNDDGATPSAVKPSVAVSDVAALEGSGGTTGAVFTVTRSGSTTSSSSVTYATANGTATAGSDYTAIPATTLSFAAGETSKTVTVTVNGDRLGEGNETFKLNLTTPVNATLADTSATGTVIDEEGPIFASVTDTAVAEGSSGARSATFRITLSAPPGAGQSVSVKYATANGTATSGSDYTAIAATPLTFAAGETSKAVTVSVTGDTAAESNETFKLSLTGPTQLVLADTSGLGTIANDD